MAVLRGDRLRPGSQSTRTLHNSPACCIRESLPPRLVLKLIFVHGELASELALAQL